MASTNFVTASINDRLHQVIAKMLHDSLSMIPILWENGELYNIFSKYDFSVLASLGGHINLDAPVKYIIDQRPDFVEGCVTMPVSSTIGQILRQIADKNLHRMMLTDDENNKRLVAVVSLRHVLKYLCQSEIYDQKKVDKWMNEEMNSIKQSLDQSLKDGQAGDRACAAENGNSDGLVIDEEAGPRIDPDQYEYYQRYDVF